MENQHAVQSPVGEVVDVATPSSRKLRALGLLWTLIALSTFVLINYLIVQALGGDDPILSTKHPASLVGSLLIPWFAGTRWEPRFKDSMPLRSRTDISVQDLEEFPSACLTIRETLFSFRFGRLSLICLGSKSRRGIRSCKL
jgi:hypothetical protein